MSRLALAVLFFSQLALAQQDAESVMHEALEAQAVPAKAPQLPQQSALKAQQAADARVLRQAAKEKAVDPARNNSEAAKAARKLNDRARTEAIKRANAQGNGNGLSGVSQAAANRERVDRVKREEKEKKKNPPLPGGPPRP